MKNRPKENPFKLAVEQTPEIKDCWKQGLQALPGDHSKKIKAKDNSKLCGSVFLDKCLDDQILSPGNRWDYIICYDGKLYFLEIHSAHSGEVDVVRRKVNWLKDWLNSKAPELVKLKAKDPYHWVQSGKFAIPKNAPQFRTVTQEMKLKPKPSLMLP